MEVNMKRIVHALLIALALLLSVPVAATAAPKGYKEITITKKNAKKYLAFKKFKDRDSSGDYNGYSFRMYSKMRKKGYYVYDMQNFSVRVSYKHKYKYKFRGRTYKYKYKGTANLSFIDSYLTGGSKYSNYGYGKISSVKFKKAKGKMILIEPSNVISVQLDKRYEDGDERYIIKLKEPYDSTTPRKTHYDAGQHKVVTDYYYVTRFKSKYSDYDPIKNY